jgi:glycosyltransferase involved in cell wall biosynthesis
VTLEGRRVLYISYNGMLDPLGQSQVLPYLRELSRLGVRFTLLSFERSKAYEKGGLAKCASLHQELAAQNIDWHWLPYHQKPSLPATAYDVLAGVRYARRLARRGAIELVHARSHIPAAIALALKRQLGLKLIFDVRGLMADEYVDAGHWQQNGIRYRLTRRAEHRALAAADGVVTLTERIWPILCEREAFQGRSVPHEVVPCCVDLDRFRFSEEDRVHWRRKLGLEGRFVVVYSGSIGGWYLTAEMADFFVRVLQRYPDAHFLWLTHGPRNLIGSLMEQRRISPAQYSVAAIDPEEMPSYLSAGDLAIAFFKACFSKLASSPIKLAEYLACGLPVLVNSIGDVDSMLNAEDIGVLLSDLGDAAYAEALIKVGPSLDDLGCTRQRTREAARRWFDLRMVGVARYARLYAAVLGNQQRGGG